MDTRSVPPLIDACRVLYYAIVDSSVTYTRRSVLYVDGVEIDPVPRLAICRNLVDDGILLLHCDDEWNSLGASGSGDVDEVMAQANRSYAGVASAWIKAPYSEIDVAKAIADTYADQRCSFCGRYHFELGAVSMAQGDNGAMICGTCVARLQADMPASGEP